MNSAELLNKINEVFSTHGNSSDQPLFLINDSYVNEILLEETEKDGNQYIKLTAFDIIPMGTSLFETMISDKCFNPNVYPGKKIKRNCDGAFIAINKTGEKYLCFAELKKTISFDKYRDALEQLEISLYKVAMLLSPYIDISEYRISFFIGGNLKKLSFTDKNATFLESTAFQNFYTFYKDKNIDYSLRCSSCFNCNSNNKIPVLHLSTSLESNNPKIHDLNTFLS